MMSNNYLTLLVENSADAQLIQWIFQAAKISSEQIVVTPMRGRQNIIKFVNNLAENIAKNYAVLVSVDLEKFCDSDLKSKIDNQFNSFITLFYAVPDVTAWLFADKKTAIKYVKSDWGKKLIEDLPAPDEISDNKNKAIAKVIFGEKYSEWDFLKHINIDEAMKSSSSLKDFIEGINKLLIQKEDVASNMNLKVFAGLVNEVVPSDTVLWKTSQGRTLTAEEISHEIESGSEIGLQYASDVLRVSRDFLKSMAKRRNNQ